MKRTAFLAFSSLTGFLLGVSGDDLSPTLEVLPLNSTLSDVTIPHYDQEQNRIAYLKADLMEILADGEPQGDRQPIMVDCSGIQLQMKMEDIEGNLTVNMEKARYRLSPGVLAVQEQITARSPRFHITGNGGVFHLDSRRGFLFGPIECQIQSNATAYQPTMTTPLLTLLATTSLVALNPAHQPTTAEELLEVEALAKSSQSAVSQRQKEIIETATSQEKESREADKQLAAFAKQVESDSLNQLTQNPPPANAAVQAKPPLEAPDLTIHCDGGCFFDGNENLLALLRNVVVKEKRFTLKAQKEIKVFFLTESEEENKAAETEDSKTPKLNITDIKSLVATGGVHFSGVDKDGNPVEAAAETAYYNNQTKTLILKDGKPTFWTKKGKFELHMQAENENAHVKIVLSEDTMRADTSQDGWTLGGNNLPLNRD